MIEYEVWDFSANGPNRGLLTTPPDRVEPREPLPAPMVKPPVTPLRDQILAALAHDSMSVRELQAYMGHRTSTIASVCSILRNEGLVGFTPCLTRGTKERRAQGRYWLRSEA